MQGMMLVIVIGAALACLCAVLALLRPGDCATEPSPILRRGQVFDLIVLPAVIILIFILMASVKYDYVSMLWEKALGIKMLIGAVLQLIIGETLFAGIYIARNRLPPARSGLHLLLGTGLFLTFVLCIVPVVFVILVGPAAIQIIEG